MNDSFAPSIVWSKTNDKTPTAVSFIFDTNEPTNGSVEFYNTDSVCSAINTTLLDSSATDNFALTNFRPHHVAEKTGLTANTTYYFKYRSCDPSNNCALSRCTNVTTALSHTNITFKIVPPNNWTIEISALNITNFSGQYGLRASTQFLSNLNITINSPDNRSGITFVGVDIFEKRVYNISQFVNGSGYVGMDANQYQSFKQKTGVEQTMVRVPTDGTASVAEHCDDSGVNCQDITSTMGSRCTFASGQLTCVIPDAVGLGFSSYKGGSGSGGGDGGSGGGGGSKAGGSGGGSPSAAPAAPSTPSSPPAYATKPASESKPIGEGADVSDVSTAGASVKEAAKEEAGALAGKAAALAKEGEPREIKTKWALIFAILGLVAVVGFFAYAKSHRSFEIRRR